MHHDMKSVRWLSWNRRWNSYTFGTHTKSYRTQSYSRFRSSVQRLRKAWIESHCNRFPRSSEIPKHCPCRLRPHDIQPPVQRSTKDKRPAWVFFLSGRGLVDLQPRNCRSGVGSLALGNVGGGGEGKGAWIVFEKRRCTSIEHSHPLNRALYGSIISFTLFYGIDDNMGKKLCGCHATVNYLMSSVRSSIHTVTFFKSCILPPVLAHRYRHCRRAV